MFKLSKYLLIGICFALSSGLFAHDAGSDAASLNTAIANANAGVGGDFTVNFNQTVALLDFGLAFNRETPVRALGSNGNFVWLGNNIVVNGNRNVITATQGGGHEFTSGGSGNARGFFIGGLNSGPSGSVRINDLHFASLLARGGDGAGGGGGGLGAGGGVFIGKGTRVTLSNCQFSNCAALGGNGSTVGGDNQKFGGGGGMRGNGGTGSEILLRSAGGGGGGFGGSGSNARTFGIAAADIGAGGGCNGFPIGNADKESPGANFDGSRTDNTGGVGGGPGANGNFGGGGGGTRFGTILFTPGNGGFGGGGGGGGNLQRGGAGGFGGGGGNAQEEGGNGGFGGGGGGFAKLVLNVETGGTSPFGGENGSEGRGGNGAALGGAIFIEREAQVTIEGSLFFSRPLVGATGRAAALGPEIFMMSSSLLTFDITSNVTLENPIAGDRGAGGGSTATGAGGLVKKGPGILTLTGNQTYTGGTRAENGTLRVVGSSLLDDVEVLSGATLAGAFEIIDGDLINNGGTIEPGDEDGIGTIDVGGDFINNGAIHADIQPGLLVDNDAIAVAGKTILGPTSTLVLNPLPGNYIAGTDFVIIDGVTQGTFGTVFEVGPLAPFLDFEITYSSVIATVLNNRIFKDQNVSAGPAQAVVDCVLAAIPIAPHSDFAQMVEELGNLTDKQVNRALVTISPVQYGALEWINARNNSYIVNLLSQFQFELCCSPRDCCSCTCNSNVWINGFGNFINNHEKLDHLQPYTANAGGVLAGFDYCCGPCYYIGASVGYVHTDLEWHRDLGHGELNTYLGALYGIFKGSCLNFDFSLIGGGTENDIRRRLEFGDVNRKPKSDFWSQFFTVHIGARTNWEYCSFNWEPFALLDYHFFHRNHFHEHDAQSLDLEVKSKNQSMMRLEAGFKGYYSIICDCYCFAPYLGLSYVGESPLGKSRQKGSFTDQSCVINAVAYDSWVNLGSGEAGLKWTHVNGFSFVVGYKGLFNTKTSINEVEGRLEWVF